jgi:Zn-dependent protease
MFSDLTSTQLIYIFASLVIGIVVHELMHGVVAYWLGDRTAAEAGRLTLNPLASVDPFMTILLPFVLLVLNGFLFLAAKPVPFNPDQVKWGDYGAALVGLAGPATNLVLAIIGAIGFRIFGGAEGIGLFFFYFTGINVAIMLFNMIPIPPLDGSRVLYAFAPDPVREIMNKIESFGFIFLIIILLLLFPVISPILGELRQGILQVLLG